MNIHGIGTEIIECPRIGRMIQEHGELFLRRVYTDREIRYCQAREHATEHFAASWAAKGAILKAIGVPWSRAIARTDLEIRQPDAGGPKVHVRGAAKDVAIRLGIGDVLLTVAYCRTYATAYAMALGAEVAADVPDRPGA